ncbi:MAG TPA: hypothetical protein VGC60_09180 [Pyrinomonadaceae bacterium]|jgi:hypothetical protein
MNPRLAAILANVYILTVKGLNTFLKCASAKRDSAADSAKAYPLPRTWAYAALLFLIMPLDAVTQTTIVIRRTSHEIVIGADSMARVTTSTVDSLGQVREETVKHFSFCKIVVVGNRAFVMTGFLGTSEREAVIKSAGRSALESTVRLADAADTYSNAIKERLSQDLERERLVNLESYRDITLTKDGQTKNVLETMFFAIENGIPKITYRSFFTTNDESRPVSLAPGNQDMPNKVLPNTLNITGMAGGTSKSRNIRLMRFSGERPEMRRALLA